MPCQILCTILLGWSDHLFVENPTDEGELTEAREKVIGPRKFSLTKDKMKHARET